MLRALAVATLYCLGLAEGALGVLSHNPAGLSAAGDAARSVCWVAGALLAAGIVWRWSR